MFIFNSMFLLNLQQTNSTINDKRIQSEDDIVMDNFYGLILEAEQLRKLSYVGNRIKNVNKKEAIARFQGDRPLNSRSPEAKYI